MLARCAAVTVVVLTAPKGLAAPVAVNHRERQTQSMRTDDTAAMTWPNVKPGIHILRHSFCSHLAMHGAPARAIQELAGHQDLGTTQRYMHLRAAALDAAIRLLETGTEAVRVTVEK